MTLAGNSNLPLIHLQRLLAKEAAMKPQLKSYVYFAPVASGIFFRGVGAEFILKGKGLYDFLSPILSRFDGSNTLDDIKGSMSENQQKVVDTVVNQLMQTNMLVDNSLHNTAQLTEQERKTFKIGLQYLTDKAPNKLNSFANWRAQSVAVIGHGPAQATMVEALLEQGVKHIYVIPMNDAAEFMTVSEDHLALYQDLNQSFQAVESHIAVISTWEKLQDITVDKSVFTLANLDDSTINSILEKAFLPYSTLAGLVSNIGSDQLVIANNPVELLNESHELAKAERNIVGTSIIQQQLSAAVLVQALFDEFFGIASSDNQVTVIEESLTINEHSLLSGQYAIDWHQEDLSKFLTSTKVLVDEKFGIFSESNGKQLPQIPLNVDKLTVPSVTDHTDVVVWGHDLADATRKVTKSAISHYLQHKLGFECFIGFSEEDAKQVALSNLTAQLLANAPSLKLTPITLDHIDDAQTKKLVNTAEIYGDNFQCFLVSSIDDSIVAMAGTLDGELVNFVCGFDRQECLNELLAQLILNIQLPGETLLNVFTKPIKACQVTTEAIRYSAINEVASVDKSLDKLIWQPVKNNPLAHLGVYVINATLSQQIQGVHHAA